MVEIWIKNKSQRVTKVIFYNLNFLVTTGDLYNSEAEGHYYSKRRMKIDKNW